MKIKYHNKKIEALCTDYGRAKMQLGQEVATKLFAAVNYISSAKSLQDVKNYSAYNLHLLIGQRKGQYAIDLGRKLGFRLIIIPLNEKDEEWVAAQEHDLLKATKVVIIWEVNNHYE